MKSDLEMAVTKDEEPVASLKLPVAKTEKRQQNAQCVGLSYKMFIQQQLKKIVLFVLTLLQEALFSAHALPHNFSNFKMLSKIAYIHCNGTRSLITACLIKKN